MLNTAPRYSNEQACHAANEEHRTQPVNSLEFLLKRELRRCIEVDEEDCYNEADSTKRVIDVKCPSPSRAFDKFTTNYWTDDRSNTPATKNHGEVLRALSQGNNVAKDNLRQRYDSAAADSLDASPSEQRSEVVRDGT